jgi:hypothetical protein
MRRSTISLAVATAAAVLAASGAGAGAASKNGRPAFASYAAPQGMGDQAGEPTLGVDLRTGVVLFQSGERTLRVTGLDGHGHATWRDVSPLLPGLYTFDPILETDPKTGRTFSSQLDTYCSRMAYTDDDGAHWTQVPLGCGLGAAFDHQTVGVAKFRGPHDPDLYPNVVYYCAQNVVTAMCGTSLDGGYTFGPAVAAYSAADCTTIHGHVKSAPDGTAYLPPAECGGRAALARTLDDGRTWTLHRVPGSATNGSALHPSVGVGSDGTVYYAWGGVSAGSSPGGPPYAAVSRNRGETWTKPQRLGADAGIVNTRFVTTVAGDGDRAAVAYLGSRTAGNASDPSFLGEWHLYVSFTYDRGRHWSTVDATPRAPVQVGSICTDGTLCTADRNLLDFNDLVIDGRGRVLAAIADGCPGSVCTPATRASKATIVRQESGRGLLRRYDPK